MGHDGDISRFFPRTNILSPMPEVPSRLSTAFADRYQIESHLGHGDKELAIENYKKSLELNPNNENAVEMLKRLERRQGL